MFSPTNACRPQSTGKAGTLHHHRSKQAGGGGGGGRMHNPTNNSYMMAQHQYAPVHVANGFGGVNIPATPQATMPTSFYVIGGDGIPFPVTTVASVISDPYGGAPQAQYVAYPSPAMIPPYQNGYAGGPGPGGINNNNNNNNKSNQFRAHQQQTTSPLPFNVKASSPSFQLGAKAPVTGDSTTTTIVMTALAPAPSPSAAIGQDPSATMHSGGGYDPLSSNREWSAFTGGILALTEDDDETGGRPTTVVISPPPPPSSVAVVNTTSGDFTKEASAMSLDTLSAMWSSSAFSSRAQSELTVDVDGMGAVQSSVDSIWRDVTVSHLQAPFSDSLSGGQCHSAFICQSCQQVWDGIAPQASERRPYIVRVARHVDRRLGKVLRQTGDYNRRVVLLKFSCLPVPEVLNRCVWKAMQASRYCPTCVGKEVTLQSKQVHVQLKDCVNFIDDIVQTTPEGRLVVLPHILLPSAAAEMLASELNREWMHSTDAFERVGFRNTLTFSGGGDGGGCEDDAPGDGGGGVPTGEQCLASRAVHREMKEKYPGEDYAVVLPRSGQ